MTSWTVFKARLELRPHRGVEASKAERASNRNLIPWRSERSRSTYKDTQIPVPGRLQVQGEQPHARTRERESEISSDHQRDRAKRRTCGIVVFRPRTPAFAALCGALAIVCVATLALSAQAEITQRGDLRVAFQGKLSPRSLPRSGAAPVTVSIGTRIATADGATPPQLRSISIAVNRHGRFDRGGLPVCSLRDIQPATNANALAACRSSLVGHGTFSAKVLLPQSSPFPSDGQVLAFNGRFHGRPAILAHVFGPKPIPTSYTIPFVLAPSRGTFGTTLTASLPQVTGNSGYITGLTLDLQRSFSVRGRRRSYVSASCPAPPGIALVSFPFARAGLDFADGRSVSRTLTRSCRARG